MKTVQILAACLILAAFPLMIVQADDSGIPDEQMPSAQAADETMGMDDGVYAESLFNGRCQMCHQLPEPGMLKPKQWKLILTIMQQRMQQAGVPPLTTEETRRLLEYLSARAR
jgi:hypothetical protein